MEKTIDTFSPFLAFWQLLSVLIIILSIIALIDILRHDFKENNKLIWVLVVIFTNLLGVFMYYKFGTQQKIKRELL